MRRTEKEQAINLRLQGKSYNEIRKVLNIPSKGTLSYWFKDLWLPPDARKRLAHNIALASERGLLRFNKERSKAIRKENKNSSLIGKQEIGKLTKRELLLVGAALYWGEGTKKVNDKNNSLVLSNSDPELTALFLRFVREILKVPEDRIRAGIQLHPNSEVGKARRFWARVTGLPKERFYIVTQVSRASRSKRPKNSLPHGTVNIRINKRVLFHKVLGQIEGLRGNAKDKYE